MDIDCVPSPEVFHTRTLTTRELSRYTLFAQCVGTRHWWRRLLEEGCVIAGGAALFVVQRTQCFASVGDVDVWVPGNCGERLGVYVCELIDWLQRRGIDFGVRVQYSMITVWNAHLSVQFIKSREATISDILVQFDMDFVQCALHFCDSEPSGCKQLHVTLSTACAQAHETGFVRFKNARHWLFRNLPDRDRVREQRDAIRARKCTKKGFEQISQDGTPAAGQLGWHICRREHRPVSDSESLDFLAMHSSGTTYRNTALSTKVVEQINQMCARPAISAYVDMSLEERMKLGIDIVSIDDVQHQNQIEKQEWIELPCRPSISRIDLDSQRAVLRDIERYEKALKNYNHLHSPNKQLRIEFGVRNLKLLMDPSVPLSEVQTSIRSDRLKCTSDNDRSDVAFALGVQMLLAANRAPTCASGSTGASSATGRDVYETIRREFLD